MVGVFQGHKQSDSQGTVGTGVSHSRRLGSRAAAKVQADQCVARSQGGTIDGSPGREVGVCLFWNFSGGQDGPLSKQLSQKLQLQ